MEGHCATEGAPVQEIHDCVDASAPQSESIDIDAYIQTLCMHVCMYV